MVLPNAKLVQNLMFLLNSWHLLEVHVAAMTRKTFLFPFSSILRHHHLLFSQNPGLFLYCCQHGPVPTASTFLSYNHYFLIIPSSQPDLLLKEITFFSQISFSADFFFSFACLICSFFSLFFHLIFLFLDRALFFKHMYSTSLFPNS